MNPMHRIVPSTVRTPSPAVLAIALALAAGCTATPTPRALATNVAEVHAMTVTARGAQVYECRIGADGISAWALVQPDAELFDAQGHHVGHHGAGPHWQADDGSRIDGRVKARVDAPAEGAIAWLLLEARSTGPRGVFDRMTSVQRVNTVGGVAPATPCARDNSGVVMRVAYQADYRLFAPRASSARRNEVYY